MALGFKTGGRQKGTPNKQTLQNREKMQKLFDEEMDSGRVAEALRLLPPAQYLNFMVKLSAFITPKANNENTQEEPKEKEEPVHFPVWLPVATKEEADQYRKEDVTEETMAMLVYYNLRNVEKWYVEGKSGISPQDWQKKYGEAAKIARQWAIEQLATAGPPVTDAN